MLKFSSPFGTKRQWMSVLGRSPGDSGVEASTDRKLPTTVAIVGPAPGQAGGISSVMSYLYAATKDDDKFRLVFLDTLKNERWSIPTFFKVVCQALWLVATSERSGLVFHLNVSTGGSTLRKWFISLICRLTATPYIVHLHGSKYKQFYSGSGAAVRWVSLQLFKYAQTVIVLGRAWREYAIEELRVPDHRVAIVPNGTPEQVVLGDLDSDVAGKTRVIFSGRISRQKGVPELLSAADMIYRDHPNFELMLMGDCRDEALLDEARSKPYCVVTGWLKHADVVRQLRSSDIFTLPSHDEGLPMAMIEAMSLAKPVVVTTVGAIEDVIDNGQEGFLVRPGDVDELREALEALIADSDLRSRMGQSAQLRWRKELEAGEMAEQIKLQWSKSITSV